MAGGKAMDVDTIALDESLYNRQLYVLGHDAMRQMGASNVLIVGCDGVAVEIAKNLVLAGVKLVEVNDTANVTYSDLSSQFFLAEEDIGKARVDVTVPKLAELNKYVQIVGSKEPLSLPSLSRFQVVICSCVDLSQQLELSDHCHAHDIKFIAVNSHGVFGGVFCDFGSGFVVHDSNGEPPVSGLIAGITQEENSVVSTLEDGQLDLQDGDVVMFSDIRGMDGLNGSQHTIKSTSRHSFTIGDTRGLAPYASGGRFVQVKQPVTHNFMSFRDALEAPTFVDLNSAKTSHPLITHLCIRALDTFFKDHHRYPAPGNQEDGTAFVALVREREPSLFTAPSSSSPTATHGLENGSSNGATHMSETERVVRAFAHCATGRLNPMAALLGGIAAQEALKACTGKFTPVKQFLYFDAIEALPNDTLSPAHSPQDFTAPPGLRRYESQIAVFGTAFQEKLLSLRYFMVGAGAIGCEMLKNMALMGVGCGPKGHITVTDMDRIEKSNLNRQFLFRPWHIDCPKSTTAAEVVKAMNPSLSITGLELRVGPETETHFSDEFYDGLDGICNALDNVEARLYMDSRSVLYRKPLLESGTRGTTGNVQVVVPHITESYGSSADPPEKSIPTCTLKHFPNKIEHTIQWARDEFEGLFAVQPADVNQYLTDTCFVQKLEQRQKQTTLAQIRGNLVDQRPRTFDECIAWAKWKFAELFNHSIAQLLHNFPLDQRDSSGNLFWSGPKQAPTPIEFNSEDELHMAFVIACANLRAFNYGLEGNQNRPHFKKVLANVHIPPFAPKSGVRIPTTEREATAASDLSNIATGGVEAAVQQLAESLPQPNTLVGFRLLPVEFEKDSDTNHHMAFITATSNLRATNYQIPTADLHETKRIAGKIIPAIATTTALVTGLVAFELYKLHAGAKKLEDFKNTFVNLALPFMGFSDPVPPPKVKGNGGEWTLWDKTVIDEGDITLREFVQLYEKQYKVEVSMISCGRAMLFTSFSPKKKLDERYPMRMSELFRTVAKRELPPGSKYLTLELGCCDEDGNDIEVPTIRFKYR